MRQLSGASAQTSARLLAVAESLATTADVHHAIEQLADECARALDTRVAVFESARDGWILAGQSGGRMRVSLSELDRALHGLPTESVASVNLRHVSEGIWTALTIAADANGAPLCILIAGDWTAFREELDAFCVYVALALRCAHERGRRERAERTLLRSYRLGRHLSRADSVDAATQHVVDELARELRVERVAVALYDGGSDRLIVAATHGYPAASVRDVRIEPGSWVIGHVFATRRPVYVRDIGLIRRPANVSRQYRTASFAAVPMFAGAETIGVISATDKRDGSPLEPQDARALRTFAIPAGLSIAAAQNSEEATRLSHAVTTDTLTGLFNRSYFDARLHQELERARRAGTSVTVLLLDIDDFKRINDTHGHQVGDAMLQAVAQVLRATVRVFDICARIGGDEFAVLMPTTDHARAASSAERIRQRVSSHAMLPSGPQLTVSIGVAVSGAFDTAVALVGRADRLLYKAKEAGKNRVCVATVDEAFTTVVPAREGRALENES